MVKFCYPVLCVCVCLFQITSALYEDQVGLYDWYQQYVGPVSYVSVDSNRGIIVASETGVLAHIGTQDGDLLWRKVFAPGENGWIDAVLRTSTGTLLSVSKGGRLIRSWEVNGGLLKWEVVTNLTAVSRDRPLPLDMVWRPDGVQATLTGTKQSLLAVAGGQDLTILSTKTGVVKWAHTLNLADEGVVCSITGDEGTVRTVASIERSKLVLTSFAASTGEVKSTQEVSAPWLVFETTSCLLTETYLVCLEWTRLDLYTATLTTDKPSFTLSMLTTLLDLVATGNQRGKLALADNSDALWLEIGSDRWLLSLEGPQVSLLKKSGAGVSSVSVGAGERSLVMGDSEVVELNEARGKPLLVASDKKGQTVLVMEDLSILMINQAGVVWAREDGLGAIAAAEMLDLPADHSEMIESFVEITKSEANPLKVAILRAQLQFTLTKEFLMNLNQEVASLLQYDGTNLVRDEFNTHKLIVTATANGKMYGLDSRNGAVVWQSFVSSFVAFQNGYPLLHILRTTSHPPHPPLAILIGRSKTPGCSMMIYEFNPLTGEALNPEPHCLPFQVTQTLLLPTLDHTHSKILLLMTNDNKVATFPSTTEVRETITDLQETAISPGSTAR